jgi:thymidylate synthase (FAD)
MTVQNTHAEEIQQAKKAQYMTKRPTVEALEAVLFDPLPVLDHGFVRVIDYMGDDSAIVQAARVSYGVGTKKISEDKGLIRYLMRHRHSTPFEMCEIKFHIKLPIFVARQWIRHRTANVNEYSARYSILENEFYLPSPHHLAQQSSDNKQGRGEQLSPQMAEKVIALLKQDAENCYAHYEALLEGKEIGDPTENNAESGIARELARMNLTLNFYTQWYWKIDLHNLMHFVSLRADPHAQYEIRVYADTLLNILQKWLPLTYQAFMDYRKGGAQLSAQALQFVQRTLKGEKISQEDSGLSKREWEELMKTLEIS